MPKNVTVTLPDDLAERLSREPDVSAFVADAVRSRYDGMRTRDLLKEQGFALTDDGYAEVRDEDGRLLTGVTRETVVEAADLYNLVMGVRDRHRHRG